MYDFDYLFFDTYAIINSYVIFIITWSMEWYNLNLLYLHTYIWIDLFMLLQVTFRI
jgi:hypothetical protein